MNSYQQFYRAQIERARNASPTIAGLIPINGPTGLGKTSALFNSSQEGSSSVLSYLTDAKLQGIFVTHRWNILHQVTKDAQAQGIAVSVLYARQDQVLGAVLGRPFAHEDPDTQPGDWQTHLASLTAGGLWVNTLFSMAQLRELCSVITRQAKQIASLASLADAESLKQSAQQKLNYSCKQLEIAVQQNLRQLELQYQAQGKPRGKRRRQLGVNILTESPLQQFRAHAWIRRLLPAIAWHDEQQPLLIMTTHKFFHGFFDGKRRARMADAQTQGHVIFIDEFEYQEPVLLSLLSQAQSIQELPQCLGVLIDEGMRALPRFRAANPRDENLNQLFDKLEQHFLETKTTLKAAGIAFPEQRALVKAVNSQFITRYLFHSDYTITEKPTYLVPDEHSLRVEDAPSPDSIRAGYFFSQLEQLLRHTLSLLARLPVEVPPGSNTSLREEFMHLLFNGVNDYERGYYYKNLNLATLIGAAPNTHLPELAVLAKTNTLPHTQAQLHGFSCWLFTSAKEQLDNLRIVQKRAHIPTTPEALLVTLASRNLVFCLSATAILQRTLGHFDMKWVYGALHEVRRVRQELPTTLEPRRKQESHPIPITPTPSSDQAQYGVIQYLKQIKAERRNNQLEVSITDFSETKSTQGEQIAEALAQLPADFFQDDTESSVSGIAQEYRHHSVQAMLNIIRIAGASAPELQGHLVYANSIRFIRKWLHSGSAEASRARLAPVLTRYQPTQHQLAGADKLASFVNVSPWFIPLWVDGGPLLLCLLTAESQKDGQFDRIYGEAFAIGCKVVVLTQVASATNGINLNVEVLHNGIRQDQDLSCIYLYEGRHFYFSKQDQQPGLAPMADTGGKIRQLQKLRHAGFVSEQQYRHSIASLMQDNAREISRLNYGLYKKTSDYVTNMAADVQQQMGRIERVWSLMPRSQVHLHTALVETLLEYANDPHGYELHKPMLSTLNQGVFDALQTHSQQQVPLALLFTPVQNSELIEQIIDQHLMTQIRHSRDPKHSSLDVNALQRTWESIGRAALRRDLACQFNGHELGLTSRHLTLKEWACIRLPAGADPDNGVWQRFDDRFMAEPSPDAWRYRLAPLYRWITHHYAINQWFKRHGYACSGETSSGLETQYLFHPAFSQRILQGRIGEESIRALLEAESLVTNSQLLHQHTLEVYDFHLSGTPLYVDAKYWGLTSLAEADAQFQDFLSNPDAGSWPWLALSEKVQQLRHWCDPNTRLVVMNLVGSEADASLKGLDLSLAPTDVATAPILILAGCLHPEQKNHTTSGFNGLCELAHQYLAQAYIQIR